MDLDLGGADLYDRAAPARMRDQVLRAFGRADILYITSQRIYIDGGLHAAV